FLPTGRASLLAPMFLLPGIADLMANLLSLNPMPRSILAYHSMAMVPGFIVAAVAASSSRPAQSAAFIRLSLLTTVFLTYFYLPAPAPGAYNVWRIHSLRLKRDPPIAEIHALINPDLKLSVQSNVGSFFSQRRYVYPFPAKLEDVDAVVVQFAYPYDSVDYVPF